MRNNIEVILTDDSIREDLEVTTQTIQLFIDDGLIKDYSIHRFTLNDKPIALAYKLALYLLLFVVTTFGIIVYGYVNRQGIPTESLQADLSTFLRSYLLLIFINETTSNIKDIIPNITTREKIKRLIKFMLLFTILKFTVYMDRKEHFIVVMTLILYLVVNTIILIIKINLFESVIKHVQKTKYHIRQLFVTLDGYKLTNKNKLYDYMILHYLIVFFGIHVLVWYSDLIKNSTYYVLWMNIAEVFLSFLFSYKEEINTLNKTLTLNRIWDIRKIIIFSTRLKGNDK